MEINLEWINKAIDGDAGALSRAFIWKNTKEGWKYWLFQDAGKTPLDIARLKEMRAEHFHEYRDDKPKTWGEMTPEEKGALLLAHHEGEVIQYWYNLGKDWRDLEEPSWYPNEEYRVKPHEPKVEMVKMHGSVSLGWVFTESKQHKDTHRIMFNLVDGVPDCASIKMEPIE